MPLILSGNVASATAGGYEVANSCRFNRADTAYMHKTPSSTGNRDVWSWSAWIKRSKLVHYKLFLKLVMVAQIIHKLLLIVVIN